MYQKNGCHTYIHVMDIRGSMNSSLGMLVSSQRNRKWVLSFIFASAGHSVIAARLSFIRSVAAFGMCTAPSNKVLVNVGWAIVSPLRWTSQNIGKPQQTKKEPTCRSTSGNSCSSCCCECEGKAEKVRTLMRALILVLTRMEPGVSKSISTPPRLLFMGPNRVKKKHTLS